MIFYNTKNEGTLNRTEKNKAQNFGRFEVFVCRGGDYLMLLDGEAKA
jgi:hypothetical protein